MRSEIESNSIRNVRADFDGRREGVSYAGELPRRGYIMGMITIDETQNETDSHWRSSAITADWAEWVELSKE